MIKRSHLDEYIGLGWPAPSQMERYFLGRPEERWPFEGGTDSWGLKVEGVDGTGHLEEGKGRIDIHLTMVANHHCGVLLQYRKYGGGFPITCYSEHDLSRLRDWVRTVHGDLMPIGLFIPYEDAWKAVKEFIGTNGALPTSIVWIAGRDVPAYAFPDPADNVAGR
jgi:hypothetical protein